jgi:dihydropteroate synthase
MQAHARYDDVAGEVAAELGAALARADAAGVARAQVVLDPGIGFAKTAEQSLAVLARLGELAALGRPLLVGPSRKSFLGALLGGLPPAERLEATLAACCAAAERGAHLVRVHDVGPVRRALAVTDALRGAA